MGLEQFAIDEMKRAGLYDTDADYGGMIPEAVIALVKAHAQNDHSGGSHWLTLKIFNEVINYKPLTPISADPSTGPSATLSNPSPSIPTLPQSAVGIKVSAPPMVKPD